MANDFISDNFPGNIDGVLRIGGLTAMLNAFTIKNGGPDTAAKLSFLIDQPKGHKIYTEYLAPNATTRIRLDGQMQKALDTIMAGPQDAAAAGLDKLAVLLHKRFKDVFNKRVLGPFYDTRFVQGSPFNSACRKIADKKCEGRYGKVGIVTERLGFKDKAAVKDIMIALYMDDEAAADKACRKAGSKWKPFIIKDAIKDQKGLTGYHQIKLDAKKLVVCGFENVNNKKTLTLLKQMVEMHMEYDTRKKAPKVFELVKKEEPKTSPIQKLKYEGIIKLLKAKGAIPDYAPAS